MDLMTLLPLGVAVLGFAMICTGLIMEWKDEQGGNKFLKAVLLLVDIVTEAPMTLASFLVFFGLAIFFAGTLIFLV